MAAMGIISVAGMLISYLGSWLLGGIILILNGLLVVTLLSEFFLLEEKKPF
jgi:hypothetical protein